MESLALPLLKNLPPALTELSLKLAERRRSGHLVIQAGDQGFASAPSNIALLKYWGKERHAKQVPVSSSVSRSLDGFRSLTRVTALTRMHEGFDLSKASAPGAPKPQHEFRLQTGRPSSGSENWAVGTKLQNFLDHVLSGWADDVAVSIESRNNFPTGCGVASSASGYAALVGALADLAGLNRHLTKAELTLWLTEWSRMGSGSATRSAILTDRSPHYVTWELVSDGDAGAGTLTREIDVHPSLRALRHLLVVVSAEHKAVSSSDGHLSAENSRFQTLRVAGLPERFEAIVAAISGGNFEALRLYSEEDAFAMHAVMATSLPPVMYMTDVTTAIIAAFLAERRRRKWQALWTLDAGPNVHFLVAEDDEKALREFITESFGNRVVDVLSGDGSNSNEPQLSGLVMGLEKLRGSLS